MIVICQQCDQIFKKILALATTFDKFKASHRFQIRRVKSKRYPQLSLDSNQVNAK